MNTWEKVALVVAAVGGAILIVGAVKAALPASK